MQSDLSGRARERRMSDEADWLVVYFQGFKILKDVERWIKGFEETK